MASPIPYSVADDKDLDDAALWAVIDSAAASHSSSESRKPLAIKFPNFQPLSSSPSPPTKLPRIPRPPTSADTDSRVSAESEVVHEPWIYRPPRKIARTCASEVSKSSSPLAVLRNVQRTPTTPVYSSPESHLSPEIGRFDVKEISARSEGSSGSYGWREEENVSHSLSGRFPSVSLFKEYQNAAMAVITLVCFVFCVLLWLDFQICIICIWASGIYANNLVSCWCYLEVRYITYTKY